MIHVYVPKKRYHPSSYKTSMCSRFSKHHGGMCRFWLQCKHAHAASERRKSGDFFFFMFWLAKIVLWSHCIMLPSHLSAKKKKK